MWRFEYHGYYCSSRDHHPDKSLKEKYTREILRLEKENDILTNQVQRVQHMKHMQSMECTKCMKHTNIAQIIELIHSYVYNVYDIHDVYSNKIQKCDASTSTDDVIINDDECEYLIL